MCLYIYICVCVCMCVYICVCVCIYIYIYICVYVYICMCVCVYICMCVCVYIYVCVCVYIYIYRYPAKTITDADYADDLALLANTPNQAETLLHSLERAAAGIGLHVNAHKTEYMCYNQTGNIITLDGASLRLVDKFTYLGSSVSSTENDIDSRLTKAWMAIDRLSVIWKSDLTDKMKRSFFQAAVVSILLYGCTTWTLTKRLEKKLDGNYTRMLRAILNKSWRQHPTRHQLYGHLPPITKTIQVRRTRHAGHCWRSKDELISDVLLWTPRYGQANIYVCMCVCIYVCMCVCIYVCMCVYICMYVSVYICMYVCVYMYVCGCVYMYTYVCVCVYMYVCVYIYMYICVCIYM